MPDNIKLWSCTTDCLYRYGQTLVLISWKADTIMGKTSVTVLGAGYSGLTTAAELTLRGFQVKVVAKDLGYRPPLTIVGTQVSNA